MTGRTNNASDGVGSTLGDQPPAVGRKRSLLALPGVLAAGGGLLLGAGISGALGAALLLVGWLTVPLPYLLAGGAVLGFALLDPAHPLPVVLLVGGLVGAAAGPTSKTDAPVTAVAGTVGVFVLLAGVALVTAAVVSPLAGVLTLATAFAFAAYGCHRYSVVRFELDGATAQHVDGTDRQDDGTDSTEQDTSNADDDDD